jgi:hypothetical protein
VNGRPHMHTRRNTTTLITTRSFNPVVKELG